jgi:hypothetical protein
MGARWRSCRAWEAAGRAGACDKCSSICGAAPRAGAAQRRATAGRRGGRRRIYHALSSCCVLTATSLTPLFRSAASAGPAASASSSSEPKETRSIALVISQLLPVKTVASSRPFCAPDGPPASAGGVRLPSPPASHACHQAAADFGRRFSVCTTAPGQRLVCAGAGARRSRSCSQRAGRSGGGGAWGERLAMHLERSGPRARRHSSSSTYAHVRRKPARFPPASPTSLRAPGWRSVRGGGAGLQQLAEGQVDARLRHARPLGHRVLPQLLRGARHDQHVAGGQREAQLVAAVAAPAAARRRGLAGARAGGWVGRCEGGARGGRPAAPGAPPSAACGGSSSGTAAAALQGCCCCAPAAHCRIMKSRVAPRLTLAMVGVGPYTASLSLCQERWCDPSLHRGGRRGRAACVRALRRRQAWRSRRCTRCRRPAALGRASGLQAGATASGPATEPALSLVVVEQAGVEGGARQLLHGRLDLRHQRQPGHGHLRDACGAGRGGAAAGQAGLARPGCCAAPSARRRGARGWAAAWSWRPSAGAPPEYV